MSSADGFEVGCTRLRIREADSELGRMSGGGEGMSHDDHELQLNIGIDEFAGEYAIYYALLCYEYV